MTRNHLTIVITVLVVASLVTPLAGVASANSDVIAIDENHGLNTEDSIEQYQSSGVANTSIDRIQLTVTVAESPSDVDMDSWRYTATGSEYLRIEYEEELERTVRLKLEDEMITPRVKHGLEAINDEENATVHLEPSSDSEYTIVTIELTGPTDAVFQLSKSAGILWDIRDRSSDAVSNVTGIEVSNPLASSEWQYLDPAALAGNTTTYHIDVDGAATVQYDGGDTESGEDLWLQVPDCKDPAEQPVCKYEKDGEPGVYVMSTQEDPPQVRYKDGISIGGAGAGAINELQQIVSDVFERIDSIFNR